MRAGGPRSDEDVRAQERDANKLFAVVLWFHVLVWMIAASYDGWSWLGRYVLCTFMGGSSAAIASVLWWRASRA